MTRQFRLVPVAVSLLLGILTVTLQADVGELHLSDDVPAFGFGIL
jgi:hypothetical protein